MESRATTRAAKPEADEQRWRQVKAMAGMSGESKLAWRFLWIDLRGGKQRTIRVSPSHVSADQGTESRSGRRALENLIDIGLVHLIDRPSRGPWTIYLHDPCEVAIARRATAGDGQPEFSFMEENEDEGNMPELSVARDGASVFALADARLHPPAEPAVVAPHPPVEAAVLVPHPPLADTRHIKKIFNKTQDTPDKDINGVSIPVDQGRDRSGGCGTTTADSGPRRLASVLAGVLSGPDPAERVRRIDELDRWVVGSFRQSLGCCDISDQPRRRIVTACVDGIYPIDALQRVVHFTIQRAQRGKINGSVGAYFVGAAKISMREHDSRER